MHNSTNRVAPVIAILALALPVIWLPMAEGGLGELALTISMASCFIASSSLILITRRRFTGPSLQGLMILAVLCIGTLASTLLSHDLPASVPLLVRWLFLAALASLVTIATSSSKSEEALIALLVATAFIQSLWGNYLWWGGSGNTLQGGSFYAPNQYAGFLLLLGPIPLSIALASKSVLRSVLSALVAIAVYIGVLLSGSRWGLLSATLSAVVLFLLFPAKTKRGAAKRSFLVVASLVILSWSFITTVGDNGSMPAGSLQALGSKQDRWSDGVGTRIIWAKQALAIGLDRPVSGHGLGTFGDKHFQIMPVDQEWSNYAHNDYLEPFAEGGILVAVPFLTLILFVLKKCLSRPSEVEAQEWTPGLSAGLVGGSFHVVLDHDWTYPAFGTAFVVMAFILLARSRESRSGFSGQQGKFWLVPVSLSVLGIALTVTSLGREPWDNETRRMQATALARSSSLPDLNQAKNLLLEAVELDELDWSLRIHLSQVQEALGEEGAARLSLQRAIFLAPNAPETYLQIGLFEKRNGRPIAARSFLLRGLSVVEKSADRPYLMAQRSALEQALN